MVLAWLCHMLLRDNAPFEFTIITVDHGLRGESANEAAFVSKWCAKLQIPHETLIWQHDHQINSGLQKLAREARYKLLLGAAYRLGGGAILTAHSLTDQAETVFMRLARGSGVAGLGAMREERYLAFGASKPIRLIRPLLGISRNEITQFAKENSISFCDDSSNVDQKYERVRTRNIITSLQNDEALSETALGRTAIRCQKARSVLETQTEEDFSNCAGVFHGWGGIGFDPKRLMCDQFSSERRTSMLARAIYAVGAKDFPPDEEAVAAATKQALNSGQSPLGGTMLIATKTRFWIIREAGDLWGRDLKNPPDVMLVGPGVSRVWDRRFIITNRTAGQITVGLMDRHNKPLGNITGFKSFAGPKSARLSVPIIEFVDTHSKGELTFAVVPHAMPANLEVKSLLHERFKGQVLRYY